MSYQQNDSTQVEAAYRHRIVKANDYYDYMRFLTERAHLSASALRPVTELDVISVERELTLGLPASYADFVSVVGVGIEPGGCAVWHHMDLVREGNVIAISKDQCLIQSEQLRKRKKLVGSYPKKFLVVYDNLEGSIYGFLPEGKTYSESVYRWDLEALTFDRVSASFPEFLDYLVEPDRELLPAIA